jgi:hypothetical protein
MGWFLRKSWRLLPGMRISLSKSGPRLSVGVPGARASIDMHGRTRVYAGKGPIRYQKILNGTLAPDKLEASRNFLSFFKKLF